MPSLLVLDFDGVICDSIEECFLASWSAYHEGWRQGAPSAPPPSARTRFRELRPFVRSGEDFLLIQHLVDRGTGIQTQQEFDRQWGQDELPEPLVFKELFYAARGALYDRDPRAWLALNPVYPHVAEALGRLSPEVPRYVLSTKKQRYVIPPLERHHIPVPASHVLYSDREPKLRIVERLRKETGREMAVFVEDQVDAIRGNRDPAIRTYLATWGYVQEGWLRDAGVSLLDPPGFLELVAGLD